MQRKFQVTVTWQNGSQTKETYEVERKDQALLKAWADVEAVLDEVKYLDAQVLN